MENYKNILAFIIILCLVSFLYLWNINWGTPNWDRHFQIFENEQEIKKYSPIMIKLRDNYYSAVKKIYKDSEILDAIKEAYAHNLKSKQFDNISEETKLDAMRGFFLGSMNSDEQENIVGVSNLNPLKLDFNPNTFAWGGLHFYTVAFSLIISKLLGLISLTKDINYYFLHPEEVTQLYISIRLVSIFFTILTIILFYFTIKDILNKTISLLGTIFLSLFFTVILNSKMGKPHAEGMFWTFLGFYFVLKLIKTQELKNYILAGLSFGLAGSALVVYLLSVTILYAFEFSKNKFKISKYLNKKFIYANIFFVLPFILTNHYVFTDFNGFLRRRKELAIVFNYASFNISDAIDFLIKFFNLNVHWIFIPLLILGILYLIKIKKELLWILFFPFVFLLFDIFVMRHENIFIICLPYIAILLACGVEYILKQTKLIKLIGLFYVLVTLNYAIFNAIYINKSFKKYDNFLKAGKWVNSNIKEYEKIGVPNGWFAPGNFPPFKFLKYNLINFPTDPNLLELNKDKLPEYVILTDEYNDLINSDKFNFYYKNIITWNNENKLTKLLFYKNYFTLKNTIGIYSLKKL